MSEQRFVYHEEYFPLNVREIIDTEIEEVYDCEDATDVLNEQQTIIERLKKENEQLKHQIEIEKKWQLEKDRYYVKIKEENDQLRRLFEEMKQPITINLTEEDEKELRKLLGLIDDE